MSQQGSLVAHITDHQKINMKIGTQPLHVEVVNTPASMTQGLSDRTEIGSDGMLFVFGSPQRIAFWMKDMKFDLDFVWITGGKVSDITEDATAPKTALEDQNQNLRVYYPDQAADMVLEIPAGGVKLLHIQKGDSVSF